MVQEEALQGLALGGSHLQRGAVAEPEGFGQHEVVVQGLLHQVLFELALTLHIVDDGLEALLAQGALCFDLGER